LVSEQPRRRKEQILRSYIIANRASISSLEEAEKHAELATDEPDLVQLQDETTVRFILDDTGILQSSSNRDSVWLSAAIPDVADTSTPSSDKYSSSSQVESARSRKSIPDVEDFVARYSVHVESEVQQASQSDTKVITNESVLKSQMSLTLRQIQ
jgi:hypothetical protein